jgi:D-serine deaminase-like pyridoxal phosphate-dependent protein
MTDPTVDPATLPRPRGSIETPALVVDRTQLGRNVATMAARAREYGVALRPHAKTHKCAAVARLQRAAGAVGISCAKLGEAETLAEAGETRGLLLTSPIVTAAGIERLGRLHARAPDLACVVDHPDGVAALRTLRTDGTLNVLIDVDPGHHRTGVAGAREALDVLAAIERVPVLRFAGVQFYCGAEQHIRGYDARREALRERNRVLEDVLAALAAVGRPAPRVTGGGTGTHRIDLELGLLTELQVGSYVFMDEDYRACALDPASSDVPFESALVVEATVISANHPRLATVDAGLKALASDSGEPRVVAGAPAGTRYRFMGDEHGLLELPAGARLPLGARVSLAPGHCDPTVNLYDRLHVVEGGDLVEVWRTDARGRSQ